MSAGLYDDGGCQLDHLSGLFLQAHPREHLLDFFLNFPVLRDCPLRRFAAGAHRGSRSKNGDDCSFHVSYCFSNPCALTLKEDMRPALNASVLSAEKFTVFTHVLLSSVWTLNLR